VRIGIVSDTHGHAARLAVALEVFSAHHVERIVHCGDIGSAECVRALAGTGLPAHLVLGNVDLRGAGLEPAAEHAGVDLAGQVARVPIGGGRQLVATHGHDAAVMGQLIAGRQYPYVCHGHTHTVRDERIDGVRVINPGATRNAIGSTVAVLDTETDELRHIRIR